MSPLLEEIMSPKKAIQRRMSTVSMPGRSRKRESIPQPIEISWPKLIFSTGIYGSTSPDRSNLLMDLPSPRPDDDPEPNEQESSVPPGLALPRHSCPDIRAYDPDSIAKDSEFRARKMREFESHIENNKILR
ncbi:hypothetical protein INT43_003508 [Umbelopsis isabellina]|uniref:Uncharacterized protein n=1 Tax=Mortierella isabellina TaxID=91625 RepID=A0A8H7PQW7_MORIS|nr:hypothetical protein INT43_003508 [Umbelopsis isabellina]